MMNITIPTMGQNPSRTGMPTYGSAFGIALGVTAGHTVCTTSAPVARDRQVATLVKGAFPGNSAWRPPIC